MEHTHTDSVITAFTAQAESFNTSQAATDVGLLDAIVTMADPRPGERWLEAACGPGLIARRLARDVGEVEGYDITPAMIDIARREALAAELGNVRFQVGDATALPVAADSFDGAVSRFSIHHIPLPERMLRELARVVKPGGRIVLADPVADADPDAAAWSQALERLRDPTHWASLSLPQMHAIVARAGLTIEEEAVVPLELDFDDWLHRGEADASDQALVQHSLTHQPPHSVAFVVAEHGGRRILRLQMWLARLRL
jgi:ubiquinone/menaquinone biosynthesis C-methylase UbiE